MTVIRLFEKTSNTSLNRFVLEFVYTKPACGSYDTPPPEWWYKLVDNIHYLHFGIILWGLTGFITIAISLLTKPIPEECLYRLTFWSRHSTKVRVALEGTGDLGKDEMALDHSDGRSLIYY